MSNSNFKKNNNAKKFVILMSVFTVLLLVIFILSLRFGAEKSVNFKDVFNSLFNFNEDNFNETIVKDIRFPRFLADVIVGASLAVAGAIMQGTTKNAMADSGIMGISSGSTFAVVLMIIFLPNLGRIERIAFSCLGVLVVTSLIYGVSFLGKRRFSPDRMVLSGMAISSLFSSLTTAIVLKNGTSAEMMKYMAGSSANSIWLDIAVSGPFFIAGIIISLFISRSLTILSLGDDTSKGLGANTILIKTLSTIVVLILSAISVVIIGPVGYVGLMVPHIVRYIVGVDYRYVIPSCLVVGGFFVALVDFISRNILNGIEFPIGLIITIIGVPFFIYTSRKQKD